MDLIKQRVRRFALPGDRLETVTTWGGAAGWMNYVYRPTTVDGLREVFDIARRSGKTVGFRGAGRSYGDAAVNNEQVLVDLSRMNRVLAWNPRNGVITVEPGVTIDRLWRYALGDGWWPPVVPGTSYPTIGGCLAMNVHGKNNWAAGTIGDNTMSFTALLPTGEEVDCSRDENADLFHAFIGGAGMLGCYTSITIQMKRVYSGMLRVHEFPAADIDAIVEELERRRDSHDYLVAWVDGLARGKQLGRGDFHLADHLTPGEDPAPNQTLRAEFQDLPDTFIGVVPKSIMWLFMYPFMNNLGTRFINLGKYMVGRLKGPQTYYQSFAAFNFLLDYIPNWLKAYGPGGLIQYQCFVPTTDAARVFRRLLQLTHEHRLPNYLGVVKRHRPDAFLLSHAVDGYSLAMDFKVTRRNRARLQTLARAMDAEVLAAGGRFYFAKDSTLDPETVRASLGDDVMAQFAALKRRTDPEALLQTNLMRRLFPELCNPAGAETADATVVQAATSAASVGGSATG